jgi:hypothetical protein
MRYRLERLMGIALLLMASGAARAEVFTDNFDSAHDYLTEGVQGTGWDGFIGKDPGQTVSALNASTDRPGSLFIESANSWWEGAFSPMGPFLYKIVQGDFIATVYVADFPGLPGSALARTEHADSFLMARVPNLDDAGPGEDFVCTHYFPTWNGNIRRNYDDGNEEEQGNTGDLFNCARWLQLERTGNVFTFRRSFDGVTWTPIGDNDGQIDREDMDGLALQVGLAQCMYSSNTGYVAFDDFRLEGPYVVPPNKAYSASPGAGATDVPRDSILSWTPAAGAVAHDVYFGTVLADVSAASRDNPGNVGVGKAQEPNTYDPGRLEFGQTYYWRVDEVHEDGVTVDPGVVWSFTVEPVSYPITDVNATASSFTPKYEPGKTVDGSGLNTNDEHSTLADDMWLSLKGAAQPTWIQFEFNKAYKLDKMLVWNQNQALETLFGLGAKNVTIQYSLDGDNWTDVGDFVFNQGTGSPTYTANTTVSFNGTVAKFVKLTINSNFGGILPQYGLSEVRFFCIPVWAREPKPASEATGVQPQVTLRWRSGREAGEHQVYVGTDPNTVAEGTAQMTTLSKAQYDLAANLQTTYYWKVVEVNQTLDPSTWAGDVWSFSTAQYLIVDDFEGYTNDSPYRVFQAWIDGGGFSADDFFPNGHSGNGTGSLVGYDPLAGNIMETTTVYGGRQSMPLYYDNGAAPRISEAELTLDPAKAVTDWTKYGITTLVLFFRGDPNNSAAPVYVKINGTKVLYNNGAASTTTAVWRQWNIDLASVAGLDLKNVKTLALGIGDGTSSGTGTMLFDEIRLYATPPQVAVPADPGTNGLVALYTLDGNLQDSTGKNQDATPNGDPSYTTGKTGFTKALAFDGVNDYIDLPVAPLLSTLTSSTFAAWVNVYNAGDTWGRVFDFGTGATVYMYLTPYAGSNTRFAITTSAGAGESGVTAPHGKSNGWHHLAIVIDADAMTLRLYDDGTMVRSGATTLLPKDLGTTTQNWLGRSEYTTDPYFNGALNDLRIYNRALSDGEVRYLAGDR